MLHTLIALWLTASAPLLTIHANLVKGFEPLTIKIRVSLVSSTANRNLCVGYVNSDSGVETLSCRTLDGDHEPVTFWYEWKNLHAGRYTVYAVVEREALKQLEAVTTVEILSTQ